MGFKSTREDRAEASGFTVRPRHTDADDLVSRIESALADSFIEVDEGYPSYVYDSSVYKITVVVEKQ